VLSLGRTGCGGVVIQEGWTQGEESPPFHVPLRMEQLLFWKCLRGL
jgi:hypothetical protein